MANPDCHTNDSSEMSNGSSHYEFASAQYQDQLRRRSTNSPLSVSISPIGQFTLSDLLAINYSLYLCIVPFILIMTSIS
jgi:hypothetical protein